MNNQQKPTCMLTVIHLPSRSKKINIVLLACNDSEKASYLYSIKLEFSFSVHPPDCFITRKTIRQSHIPVQLCCSVCGDNHYKDTEATTHDNSMLTGLEGHNNKTYQIKKMTFYHLNQRQLF